MKTLEGLSYDETYATLEALPELARKIGVHAKVPAASTAASLVTRVGAEYLERRIARTGASLTRGRTHTAGDATGVGTRQYERWFDVRHGAASRRRRFVKLHAVVATRAPWPFFLSAHVTPGTWGDSPELGPLPEGIDPAVDLGNVTLDKGYRSRKNAELVEARGGLPVSDLKGNATAKTLGSPARKRMRLRQGGNRRAFRCQYRRRTVVEGIFGAVKHRFGETVMARRRHTQRVEVLCRMVVWNALGRVYLLE